MLKRIFWTLVFLPPVLFVVIFFSLLFYICFNVFLHGLLFLFSLYVSFNFTKTRTKNPVAAIILSVVVVVVSVIGLGVLSASLNCARCSGPEVAIKQSTANIRSQAEMYFNNNQSSYLGVCQDKYVRQLAEHIESKQVVVEQKCVGPLLKILKPDFAANSYFNCNDSVESYAAESYLPTIQNGNEFWCVDSTGFAGAIENSMRDNLSCQ